MADLTPSAPLSISMIESFIGLPPSEEASFASPSIFEEIILKKFSRTSILFIKLKSNPFLESFFLLILELLQYHLNFEIHFLKNLLIPRSLNF